MTAQIYTDGRDSREQVRIDIMNVNPHTSEKGLFMQIMQGDGQNAFIRMSPELNRFLLGIFLAEIEERKKSND